jgi:hypothetical protein
MSVTIDWLSYRSYEFNRLNRPDIEYYRWRKIYPDALRFEEIFDNNKISKKSGEKNHVYHNNK